MEQEINQVQKAKQGGLGGFPHEPLLQEPIDFFPIPPHASLVISTDENFATAEELASLAMHLSLDQPGRKLQYWIRIEKES